YFEHLVEYQIAVCKRCRYAVWPDQVEHHLEKQHKQSRKEARAVSEGICRWAGLLQYPTESELPAWVAASISHLPLYADGSLCQLDLAHCQLLKLVLP
ncbi:hypothetical protein EJ02DRAFT_361341, partial [Clathrospora elynae]